MRRVAAASRRGRSVETGRGRGRDADVPWRRASRRRRGRDVESPVRRVAATTTDIETPRPRLGSRRRATTPQVRRAPGGDEEAPRGRDQAARGGRRARQAPRPDRARADRGAVVQGRARALGGRLYLVRLPLEDGRARARQHQEVGGAGGRAGGRRGGQVRPADPDRRRELPESRRARVPAPSGIVTRRCAVQEGRHTRIQTLQKSARRAPRGYSV